MNIRQSLTQHFDLYNQTILDLLWSNKIKLILFTIITMVGYSSIPKLEKIQEDLRRKQLHNHQYITLNEISERKEIFDKIIDVRTIEEYNKGHLNNSIHIDYNNIIKSKENALFIENKINSKDTILIYCKTGRRASLIATYMVETLKYNKENIYITNASYKELQNIFYPEES